MKIPRNNRSLCHVRVTFFVAIALLLYARTVDGQDTLEQNAIQVARNARIRESQLFKKIYGHSSNAKQAQDILEKRLAERLDVLDLLCSLSPEQSDALGRAGRLDIAELLDQLEALLSQFRKEKGNPVQAQRLYDKLGSLQRSISFGPLAAESRFAQSIEETFTEKQQTAFNPIRQACLAGAYVRIVKQQPVIKLSINLANCKIRNEDLSEIAKLPGLAHLDLVETPVSDAGLAELKNLSQLNSLTLKLTRVTDVGVAALAGLRELEYLDLGYTAITDTGLTAVKDMSQLRILDLTQTHITDAGMAHLERLTNLTRLDLADTNVSESGIAHISPLVKLEYLRLNNTQVTDAGLKSLLSLQSLIDLDLSGTRITDLGLATLSELKNPAYLFLSNTQVTAAGRAKLREKLPKTIIDPR